MAYNKLEDLYLEFKRTKTRTTKNLPLYEVLRSGERIEIPHPVKRMKNLTSAQKFKFNQWAKNSIYDNPDALKMYEVHDDISQAQYCHRIQNDDLHKEKKKRKNKKQDEQHFLILE